MEKLIIFLESWGILDSIIPFIILGIIFYTIINLTNILILQKYWKKLGTKNIIWLSLGFTLLFILPHILGLYPPAYDLITMINLLFIPMVTISVICLILNLITLILRRKK